MIHYTCDCCQQPIDVQMEPRYVVRMEVYAALDTDCDESDSDRDHLQEIQDILESLDDSQDPELNDEVYRHVRFDLCGECRKRFIKNPLGRALTSQLDFSKN